MPAGFAAAGAGGGSFETGRTNFASYDEAIANYSAKPPLNVFHPECLESYVRFGFRETPEGMRYMVTALIVER